VFVKTAIRFVRTAGRLSYARFRQGVRRAEAEVLIWLITKASDRLMAIARKHLGVPA
jgi:hypothetical protein